MINYSKLAGFGTLLVIAGFTISGIGYLIAVSPIISVGWSLVGVGVLLTVFGIIIMKRRKIKYCINCSWKMSEKLTICPQCGKTQTF
jgi:hypothetical protein